MFLNLPKLNHLLLCPSVMSLSIFLFYYSEYWNSFQLERIHLRRPSVFSLFVCCMSATMSCPLDGCWGIIPSDIIVLSIYNISNAWITHDCKCDVCCLWLEWDFSFHFTSLLYLFYLICSWKKHRISFCSVKLKFAINNKKEHMDRIWNGSKMVNIMYEWEIIKILKSSCLG